MKRWFFSLFSFFSLLFANETIVESDAAYYNGEIITLVGNVSVEHVMGKLKAKKAVLTRDESKATKIDFPWIELSDSVVLTLKEGSQLNCDTIFLDHTKMTCELKGNVRCKNVKGEVRGDKAIVDYEEIDGSIKATKVLVYDHIQLNNPENNQYALADLLTYYPDEQLMILEGKGNRVLFFDKTRNMQLSALTVHAKKNPETQKESIQGIGDVRFIFGQEEISKLKERFKW